jgi:hypothetical protein
MYRIVGGVLVLLLALPVLWAEDKPKDKGKPATPAEQYKALLKEHQDAMKAFQDAFKDAKTQEEKQKVFQDKYPKTDKLAPKFVELAEKNPKDPVAIDALVWVMNNSFSPLGTDPTRAKALDLLIRDHVKSAKLGSVCQSLSFRMDKPSEKFLRTVLEKNEHKDVQGVACLALAQGLKREADLKANSDKAAADKLSKESEKLFERAADKYADVKMPFYGSVGAKAKSELFDLRFLSVGKPAPEVEGEDQDGKKFKLSDYKGKVVLLDFWSQY